MQSGRAAAADERARSRHHPPAAHSKKRPGHAKPRPRNVGLSFTAPPLFVPSKVTVATQKLASVLQEGEKSTNIPFRSGEIWGIPDQNDQREEMVMSLSAWLKPGAATIVGATAAVAVAGFLFASGASTEELKHYDSSKKDFWLHPPDDWFMGDETQEQKGTHVLNTLPPPTGFTKQEIEAALKNIKLPPGFKIELWASGLPGARQMAWGDKGTLFAGSWFGTGGNVYAVADEGEDGQDRHQGT